MARVLTTLIFCIYILGQLQFATASGIGGVTTIKISHSHNIAEDHDHDHDHHHHEDEDHDERDVEEDSSDSEHHHTHEIQTSGNIGYLSNSQNPVMPLELATGTFSIVYEKIPAKSPWLKSIFRPPIS